MATFDGNDSTSVLAHNNALGHGGVFYGDYTLPPGGADQNPPTITSVSPTPGTELPSRDTPITFDVADASPGLRMVVVTIRYATIVGTFVVHDGTRFQYPFDSATSQRVATANGYTFTVLPRGDWPGDIAELFVYAVDRAGNLEGALP